MSHTRAELSALDSLPRIAKALESIAASLEKLANPITLTEGKPYEDQPG